MSDLNCKPYNVNDVSIDAPMITTRAHEEYK